MNLEGDVSCKKIACVLVSSAIKEEIPDNEHEKGNETEQLEPPCEEAEVHLAHL